MLRLIHRKVRSMPTPAAGLALGIASIGWCLENALPLHGVGQNIGALIAGAILLALTVRFIFHPDTLMQDIKHPVVGSIVPTFAMATMVVSVAVGHYLPRVGMALWLAAVVVHLIALALFFFHRAREPRMHHMVPSWFVPPVGIIVADVCCPGAPFVGFAQFLLVIGMVSYLIMLPLMIYRFMFCNEVPDAAKPTIAIMAAPASLSLAGYLTVVQQPSLLLCAILLGIALLMTVVIYCSFFRLLQLPFSPGYAAFTFPMAIGATALYKMSHLVAQYPGAEDYAAQLHLMATVEVAIATVIIAYVALRYAHNYWLPGLRLSSKNDTQCKPMA
ncbi:TDT family transporter [Edwardsiella hoshinae]|uniref:Tellurite resistance protein tehA n=2 Tax=Edwardsiella hoshinae TaxID=93378 RepID=A0A376D905_9GAMM|nr:TDT family transporter [Edwardsiella hoshinae]QPR28009.1 TDT family transporter [Edwardsiella hoshinae]STC85152.1 Tellurite resistance protein tehA [Edwardsiella hoshinae]